MKQLETGLEFNGVLQDMGFIIVKDLGNVSTYYYPNKYNLYT